MSKPTADDFIKLFEQLLSVLGPEAFSILGLSQLHSGPYAVILKELFGSSPTRIEKAKAKKSNFARAARQAKLLTAIRLEDTRPGEALEDLKIYTFFQIHYAPHTEDGVREADIVWQYLSRKFIQSLHGKVVTAVCGADKGRVFRADELPELVLNSRIETINGVAWHKVKDLYFSDPVHGPYKAFRLISLSELRMALHRARTEKTKGAMEDYYFRKAFYQIERRLTLTARGATTPGAYKQLSQADRRAEFAAFKTRITARSGNPARPSRTPTGSSPALLR